MIIYLPTFAASSKVAERSVNMRVQWHYKKFSTEVGIRLEG
jgi:hypothetical protein